MRRLLLIISLVIFLTDLSYANSSLFLPYNSVSISFEAASIAIGDLNGDGRNDIAITPANLDLANQLYVFLQDVSGTFAEAAVYSGGNGKGLAVGDVNNDGRADVVVTTNTGIGVFLQNSSGALDPMVGYPSGNSSAVAIADINGDGRLDVVSLSDSALYIYLQDGEGTLASPATVNLEDSYFDLAVGDANHDGRNDFVLLGISFQGQPYVGVVTQSPEGAFNSPTKYSFSAGLANSPFAIALGDVNGDGRQDILVTLGGNRPNSKIAVLFQDLGGSFSPPVFLDSHDNPGPIAVADVSNDGKKDIVVAHAGWEALGVYPQTQAGSPTSEEIYAIPYSSQYGRHSLAVGDLNGDGLNDVVVGGMGHFAVLYQQDSYRVAEYFPLLSGDSWIYQQDGGENITLTIQPGTYVINEVATKLMQFSNGPQSYMSNDSLGIREHREYIPASLELPAATATFIPPFRYAEAQMRLGQSITSSGTVDMDIVGYGLFTLDYTATSALQAIESITVPMGTFSAFKLQLSVTITGYVGGQYINLTENQTIWGSQNIGIVKQTTDEGTFVLLGTNFTPSPFNFIPQGGVQPNTAVTSNPITVSGISAPALITVTGGEYNIDGGAYTSNPGIVNNGQVVILRHISSGIFGGTATATLNIGGVSALFSVTTASRSQFDFNGDGKPDLIWRNTATGRTTIWYMDGATWNGGYADVLPTLNDPNWSIVGVADFNGDNNPDLLWRNSSTGRTTIWYMDGATWNGGFADVEPTLNDPDWSIVGVADFNGGGDIDILWRNASTGRTTIWYMTGPTWNGGYADVLPTLNDPNWSIVGIADFNGDSNPDLLWRNSTDGRTMIWYMTGPVWNGGYAEVLPTLNDPNWSIVAVRDFNGDGSPDLLWRNTSSVPGDPNGYRTTVWYMDGPVWNGNWGDLLPVVSDPDWYIVGK